VGLLPAALINSTFTQGFELDDYHNIAPIHSSSIVLPALCALSQHLKKPSSGSQFLLAAIVGYELGPRVGFGLRGGDVLSRGWHSGVVFGHAASAAACSKLMGLSVDQTEDAIGIACTQACGLMSAQFGAMVKRMQHGFASRNGLFAAMMASQGYTAMKGVLELPYGGFVSTFGNGGTKDPPTTPEKITEGLGKKWVLGTIVVKPYASMAATHATIDGILKIQNQHVDAFKDVDAVDMIRVEMSDGAFKKGGWAPTRPTDSTSAQMSGPYAGATQIIDNAVLAAQFSTAALERDEVWQWVNKFKCEHSQDLDIDEGLGLAQRLTVTFKDSSKQKIEMKVAAPKGIDPLLSNEEIVEKYELLTKDVTSVELRDQIKNMVLSLDEAEDVGRLVELLSRRTRAIPGF
jgi:aconitate decarboxylase